MYRHIYIINLSKYIQKQLCLYVYTYIFFIFDFLNKIINEQKNYSTSNSY